VGWLEFTTTIVGQVLSWPVVVLIVVIVLRRPLSNAISRLRQVEGLGGSATFEEVIAEVQIDARRAADSVSRVGSSGRGGRRALGHPDGNRDGGTASDEGLDDPRVERYPQEGRLRRAASAVGDFLDRHSPERVILSAYDELAWRLESFIFELPFAAEEVEDLSPPAMARLLLMHDVVKKNFADAVVELCNLRNRVAHAGYEPTRGQAIAYRESVDDLLFTIRYLSSPPNVEPIEKAPPQ
jgi:hypothetical protein